MYMNFTQKLMEAKRRARLMGRPLTRTEVAGISAGYAATASERLARHKTLALQERMHTETLAQRKYETEQELQIAEQARRQERKESTMTALGAGVGTLIAPGIGTAVGAFIGSAMGGCIIISACTNPNSYEVNIAREYRDSYMSIYELAGYYSLAEIVVPIMPKKLVKRYLVDRLVDYGEVVLGYKKEMKFYSSRWITRGFLDICSIIGRLLIGSMEVENA